MEEIKFKEVKNAAWDNWDERAWWEETKFTIPEIKHNIWPRTNQGLREKTSSACTIVWALNQIIRLFWLDLTKDESNNLSEEVVGYAAKYWYAPWYWWDTPTAINTVVKWWNETGRSKFWKEKVFRTKFQWNTEKPQEALKKWHLVGFTFALNFWQDRYDWLVWRDSYPAWTGHRTNWQSTKTTVPSWGAKEDTADCWVYDSYYWYTNQYLIRDRSKYMWKWMYLRGYLIMPESAMDKTIEENKELVAQTKAMNYVLWSLTTAWASVPEKYQEKFAALAKEIREDYEWARQLENEPKKKWAEALTDALSFLYSMADTEDQKKYASYASELRGKYNFK